MSSWLLIALFAITALLYAMVGFGGGSTYNALLVLGGTDYRLIPVIALSCNIIVVTGGVIHFARAGHLRFSAFFPFVLTSVPMALLGGSLVVPERMFISLLGVVLLVSGVLMFYSKPVHAGAAPSRRKRWLVGLPVGAMLGLLAGIVGIGGGIFLAPLMHLLNWDRPKTIAASASAFILVNSLSGLAGQLSKWQTSVVGEQLLPYLALLVAVLFGGQLGSYLGAGPVKDRLVRGMTALLVLYVSIRLIWRALVWSS